MDFTTRDEQTRALIEAHEALLQRSDPHTGRAAKRLLKHALARHDDALAGHACYCVAFSAYYLENNYPSFLKHVRLALTYLSRSGNREAFVHVYYLVAMDALRKDMPDMAYGYFLLSRNLASASEQPVLAAILDQNIGNVLMQTKRFSEARVRFADSLAGIRKEPSHHHYHFNLVSCHINDIYACIETNRITLAEREVKQTEQILPRLTGFYLQEARFCLTIMKARISLIRNDRGRLSDDLKTLRKDAKDFTEMTGYLTDLQRLFSALLHAGYTKESKMVIDLVARCGIASDATPALRTFVSMQIDYYAFCGMNKKLLEAYQEQTRVYRRLVSEQQEVYRFMKDLVSLTGMIQQASPALAREREELSGLAETDALTQLPNRYALNNRLETAYERMYRCGGKLGVCIIDLDGLKTYNDTHGHEAGDRLLQAFSTALQMLAREYDFFAARYGGDEFILIGENKTIPDFKKVTGLLRRSSGARFSAGICNRVPDDKSRPWDFFSRADRNMYASKFRKHM